MGDLVQIGSAAGIVLLLATVVGYLLTSNRQDRQQHREERLDLRAQIKDLEDRHTVKLVAMEARIAVLEVEVATERKNVAAAESRAVQAELRADRAEHRLELLQGGRYDQR